MVEVECCSGYRVNQRPVSFTILECDYTHRFKVREVIDSWLGETADYYKVMADDDNVYLLKYDGQQDAWDLVFYQDPRRIKEVQFLEQESRRPVPFVAQGAGTQRSFPIH